jgi:O-antigen ligase
MISRATTSRRLFSINRKEDLITTYVAFIFVAIQIISNSIIPILLKSINTPIQVALYLSFIIILIVAYPNYRLQPKSLLLIIATATSIVVNEIDAKYMAGTRWILWVLLLASIGPLFSNKILLRLRIKILNIFLYGFIIVTIISFIYYLLGLPQIGRGNFGGIINHSMRLGPIAAISGIYSFYKYLINNRLKTKYYYLFISLISSLVVILAASRLAFAGYIAGMIFLFAKPFKYRIIYALLIISMGIVVYARIEEGTDKTKQSIDKEIVRKGTNNSREGLWNDRINEFKSNPMFGVGFAAQNDNIIEEIKDNTGGRIEPGSGYLMILSMTGLFGLTLILWYFYFLFNSKRFWTEIFNNEPYKLSLFAFFAVHFIGEGYIFSVGSIFAVLFWLMVGVTFPYANVKKKKIVVKKVKIAS